MVLITAITQRNGIINIYISKTSKLSAKYFDYDEKENKKNFLEVSWLESFWLK